MPSTILSDNGVTSGTAGIKTTGSNDGALALQTTTAGGAATTALEINTSQQVSFTAGTAAAPAITPTGDTNTGIFFPAADTIAFAEGGAEAMRIDSNGNIGMGVTPSTSWSSAANALCFKGRGLIAGYLSSNGITHGVNFYYDTGYKYLASAAAARYEIDADTHIWSNAPSGTAGNALTWTERMRIDSSGNVGIGTLSPANRLHVVDSGGNNGTIKLGGSDAELGLVISYDQASSTTTTITSNPSYTNTNAAMILRVDGDASATANQLYLKGDGNVGIGTSSPGSTYGFSRVVEISGTTTALVLNPSNTTSGCGIEVKGASPLRFTVNNDERARITSSGDFLIGQTARSITTNGAYFYPTINSNTGCHLGIANTENSDSNALIYLNRQNSDGTLMDFRQANTTEGTITVSGSTVSYNSFSGAHWTQLQQGRGYNPEIPRGTVMSSIGEMAEWKSVVWDEVIEHPAIPAVEAVEGKEAVLDEEGNVIEPAVEAVAAVEGKDAWTETIPHREAYLGNLPVGATFTEDGVTKTVVDDGNERLPKVKISDVVGDKAVYGVFQTYDEVQDMLVTALGAFVVRIAANVTVQIGDLLESNGDGCAKVQDDDVIRSKTIGKVTSTVKTATYADGSYTVPCVLYCG